MTSYVSKESTFDKTNVHSTVRIGTDRLLTQMIC